VVLSEENWDHVARVVFVPGSGFSLCVRHSITSGTRISRAPSEGNLVPHMWFLALLRALLVATTKDQGAPAD
jgi:hypothetical protein